MSMAFTSIDKMRIGGSKVRTGCKTCKIRRVKCDEGKPECHRCVRAGRQCEGYAVMFKSAPSLPVGHRFVHYYHAEPPRMNSPEATELDMQARRALDFFHHQTAFQLDQPFAIDLWTKSLACIMQHEPAVKHGVIALATLHENFLQLPNADNYEERKILALQHYGKSINAIVQLNAKDVDSVSATTLITCLLYCLIETLQGHYQSSAKHVVAGLQILADIDRGVLSHKQAVADISEPLLHLLRHLFTNLLMQAMALDDPALSTSAMVRVKKSHHIVSKVFHSTDQALAELSSIINDLLLTMMWVSTYGIDVDFYPPNEELLDARNALNSRHEKWASAYYDLLSNVEKDQRKPRTNAEVVALLVLRVNHLLCRISMTGLYSQPQSSFDEHLDKFQAMIGLIRRILELEKQDSKLPSNRSASDSAKPTTSQPLFSMTLGIIPALFFTCTRCRHYQTRLQALHLLSTIKRRETCWDSHLVTWVSRRFITIEEHRIATYRRERYYHLSRDVSPNSSLSSHSSPQGLEVALTDTTNMPEHLRIHKLEIVFSTESSAIMTFENSHLKSQDDMLVEWGD